MRCGVLFVGLPIEVGTQADGSKAFFEFHDPRMSATGVEVVIPITLSKVVGDKRVVQEMGGMAAKICAPVGRVPGGHVLTKRKYQTPADNFILYHGQPQGAVFGLLLVDGFE